MEENPCEAIKNNVRGTRILARAAEQQGVDRFILISTDKAVNPTSVMGASKRLAELAVQVQANGSGTSFAIVRFGNVLGSNGSVVPRFIEQIKRGGPVTITHPEMRRFFMLIPEAVQLVLHAAAQADNGATYVLEMGEQVKLLDMARDLIRLSGFVPEDDIPIEFVGLRPGEKLYEELVGRTELAGPSSVDKIMRVTSRTPAPPELFESLIAIEAAAADANVDAVIAWLGTVIPEYAAPDAIYVGHDVGAAPPAPPTPSQEDRLSQECPKCHAGQVHRSKARTVFERVQRELKEERLYRCDQCGWRGWLTPLVYVGAEPIAEFETPDLTALDSAASAAPAVHRASFSPRDLQ
jgi:hypothetical protein